MKTPNRLLQICDGPYNSKPLVSADAKLSKFVPPAYDPILGTVHAVRPALNRRRNPIETAISGIFSRLPKVALCTFGADSLVRNRCGIGLS
jgi:hypothetical protein